MYGCRAPASAPAINGRNFARAGQLCPALPVMFGEAAKADLHVEFVRPSCGIVCHGAERRLFLTQTLHNLNDVQGRRIPCAPDDHGEERCRPPAPSDFHHLYLNLPRRPSAFDSLYDVVPKRTLLLRHRIRCLPRVELHVDQ
jgi:hypothetical protein